MGWSSFLNTARHCRSVTRHGMIVVLAAAPGCFPYRQTYRPEITGRVVDQSGVPVVGAPIETCSAMKWTGLNGGCPRAVTTTSLADGTFAVPRTKEFEWCCFGEAPLPFTIVSVCMADGRLGGATFDSTRDPVNVTIPVSSAESLAVVEQNASKPARSSDPVRDVKERCAARGLSPPPR